MSKTSNMIKQYLLEYDITQDSPEFYGHTVKLKKLQKRHDVVCLDADCKNFVESDKIRPGQVVYAEDEDGDLVGYKCDE